MIGEYEVFVTSFTQGGFYITTGNEYDSETEIRSTWSTLYVRPTTITVISPYQWSFVCRDSSNKVIKISESLGYKNSGDVIDISNYTWVSGIRIELHDAAGITPYGKEATILCVGDLHWVFDDEKGMIPVFSSYPDKPSVYSPLNPHMWRIEDGANDGIPFTGMFPTTPAFTLPLNPHMWRIEDGANDGVPFTDILPWITRRPPLPDPELPVVEKYEVDWTAGMKQSFEYYKVDPTTWYDVEQLKMVRRGNITRDIESDTLGSASVSVSELFDECYVRIYLIVEQNGHRHREALGTYLMSSPSMNFNGTSYTIDISAYTPLMELKDNNPRLGYYTPKGTGVIDAVCDLVSKNCRAPMADSIELYKEMEELTDNFEDIKLNAPFIANYEDSWFTYISDLLSKTTYRFDIDPYGKIALTKSYEIAKMQPKWIFTDDDNSILYTDVSIDRDIFGIPNVVEVINSRSLLGGHAITVENNDPNSPVSIQRRGRRIVHRVYNPSGLQGDDQKSIERYATKLLKQLSALQITISYQHGYCPVTIGDCVMINYRKAGLENIKAIITSQSISCTPGCQVNEKAVYTEYLWGGNT